MAFTDFSSARELLMKPDVSYILNFELSARPLVFEHLAQFCEAPLGLKDGCSLKFQFSEEPDILSIDLSVSERDGLVFFEFWATTSDSGKACLESGELLQKLCGVLVECDGYELILDPSDGTLESLFVHRATA